MSGGSGGEWEGMLGLVWGIETYFYCVEVLRCGGVVVGPRKWGGGWYQLYINCYNVEKGGEMRIFYPTIFVLAGYTRTSYYISLSITNHK